MAQITVLKVSSRNACLITDGEHVCWVQGRSVREDGSLTRSGIEAMEAATLTLEQYNYQQQHAEELREQRKAEFRAQAVAKEEYRLRADIFVGSTEKAHKVWTGRYNRLYGKMVREYAYWPKSQVEVLWNECGVIGVSMPHWFAEQCRYILDAFVA